MDKSLYLTKNQKISIFRDEHSLWVTEEGKAGRRIPVRFISRVVIIGNCLLETGAITLFTENKIPVTFLNPRGDELASAVAYQEKLDQQAIPLQKIFLLTEESVDKFKTWLMAKRKDLQRKFIRHFSENLIDDYNKRGFKEDDYQRFLKKIKEYVLMDLTDTQGRRICWKYVHSLVLGLYRETVMAALIRAELNPNLGVMNRRRELGLLHDLCYMLEPDIELQAVMFFSANNWRRKLELQDLFCRFIGEGQKDVVMRFENRKKFLTGEIESIIDDLFVMLREIKNDHKISCLL